MAKLDPDTQDLTQAFESLQKSLYVLVVFYLPYIKILLLIAMAYIFYKLGHLSVKDQNLSKKKQLNQLIEQRKIVKVQIPKKIIQLSKINKILIFILVLLIAALSAAYYLNYKPITKNLNIIFIGSGSFFVVCFSIINIYKLILSRKVRSAVNLQSNISKKIDQFMQILGDKVNRLLRNHLCQQYLLKNAKNNNINQCIKQDCKELRVLYKYRFQSISSMVDTILNFDFCSSCKKRHPFDEYLQFQYRQYQDKSQSQQEQVKQRMKYLLQGLQEMQRWINQCNPCNCSKLYMDLSMKQILKYRQNKKKFQDKLKLLQGKLRK